MARRRRHDSDVSLFPFLSVLACVIGTLILLLSAVAVGGIGERSLDQVRLSERFEAAEMFLTGSEALLEDFEAELIRRKAEIDDSEKIGLQLSGLGLNPDISLQELEQLVELRNEQATTNAANRKLIQQARKLDEEVDRKSEEIRQRDAKRLRAPILIDPTGIGPDYRPFLVECTGEYLELHHSRGDFSFRIPSDEIARSAEYKKFLRQVRAINRGLVIFLIRPDGVDSFFEAENVANQFKVRNAKLPLPGEGDLDFSLMQQARR